MEIHKPRFDSNCYCIASSFCFDSGCYLSEMDSEEKTEFRKKRLIALVDRYGGRTKLGKELGWTSGAYVRQMIAGERPITEKFIERAEEQLQLPGWFNSPDAPGQPPRAEDVTKQYPPSTPPSLKSHVVAIGLALAEVDEIRRSAIAELLAELARQPHEADAIGDHITALLSSLGKRAA